MRSVGSCVLRAGQPHVIRSSRPIGTQHGRKRASLREQLSADAKEEKAKKLAIYKKAIRVALHHVSSGGAALPRSASAADCSSKRARTLSPSAAIAVREQRQGRQGMGGQLKNDCHEPGRL